MPFVLLTALALVQGLTEFLPISSSAHLVLTRAAWGEHGDPVAQLTLDVALHVGTLFAVALYFRKDLLALIEGGFALLRGRRDGPAHLAWLVLIATIPAFVAGALAKDFITDIRENIEIIGWMTLIFGAVLGVADRRATTGTVEDLNWKGALAIGMAQALALIPGVSRSGIAMTAARWLGLHRADAARFSLLLGLPTIAGAGALAGLDLWKTGEATLGADAAIGAVMSFFAAYAAIWLMMRWLRHASFMPFVIYRVALGCVLLWVAYGGAI